MTCNMTQRLISAYVDRELSEDERARVRQHLALCPDCMAVYEMTLEVKTALGSMAPVPCPECLWEDVRDRIAALPFQIETGYTSGFRPLRAIWSFARLVVPAAVAGTIVAIPLVHMIFGVSLFGPSGSRQQPIAASTPPRLVISAPASEGAGFVRYQTARMSSSSSKQFGLDTTLRGDGDPSSPDDRLGLLLEQMQDASLTCTWIGGSTHE
jgi:anti-sigma factor (TIGR02949 family)